MDSKFDAMLAFEKLLDVFQRDIKTAETLQSPNNEDTLNIRAAIVGFSYHSPTEAWGRNHYEYLKGHLPDPDSLQGDEFTFYGLCLGYLLGLYQADKVSEEQFNLAEAKLPGFILLKTSEKRFGVIDKG